MPVPENLSCKNFENADYGQFSIAVCIAERCSEIISIGYDFKQIIQDLKAYLNQNK
jgi:hypothetical protein